jgi:hypothetical protein
LEQRGPILRGAFLTVVGSGLEGEWRPALRTQSSYPEPNQTLLRTSHSVQPSRNNALVKRYWHRRASLHLWDVNTLDNGSADGLG